MKNELGAYYTFVNDIVASKQKWFQMIVRVNTIHV